jgi:hypothetical protein
MAERRRYTKREKATAVTAALASSVTAAAEQTGIPATTIDYWMDRPEFVKLREKTRDDLITEMGVLTHLFVAKIMERIDEFKPQDLLVGLGISTDKGQLLTGAATSRTETKALSDGLNDHEKRQLRNGLDRLLSEPAEEGAGAAEVGAGAEVRE